MSVAPPLVATEPARLPSLTGARFVAAFTIVVYHAIAINPSLLHISRQFYISFGVSFFFVLSGYILQHSYRGSIENIGFSKFIMLRFTRVWFCHVGVILLICAWLGMVAINFFLMNYSLVHIASVILLVHAWVPDTRIQFALNSPSWTLSVELFFYVMFPMLSRLAARSPFVCFAVCAAISTAWISAVSGSLIPIGSSPDFGALIDRNPLSRLPEFGAGMALREFQERPVGRCLSPGSYVFHCLQALCPLALLLLVLFPGLFSFLSPYQNQKTLIITRLIIQIPVFVILIAVLSRSHGQIARVLGCQFLVWLGEISFAIYLVHQPVLVIMHNNTNYLIGSSFFTRLIIFVSVTVALSAFLFHFVEKPTMRIAKRLLISKK